MRDDAAPSTAHPASVMDLVPNELLREIIRFAVPDPAPPQPFIEASRADEYMLRARTPVALSEVSTLWRAIALGTSDIWTFIFLGQAECRVSVVTLCDVVGFEDG